MKATTRLTKEERRREIVEAATREFAVGGLYGTPVQDIAKRVGVSQPYLFQLFGTKKELFIAAVRRAFERTVGDVPHGGGRGRRRRQHRRTCSWPWASRISACCRIAASC